MTRATVCPAGDILDRLLAGSLPLPEVERLSAHLEACPRCATALHSLATSDTLASSVRRAAAPPEPSEQAVVEGLLRRIKHLRAPTAPSVSEPTGGFAAEPRRRAAPAEDSAPPARPDDGDDDPTALLSPAEEQGEIGRLGGYRVLRVLGTGGMGVVFEAEDPALQRRVALKVMRPSLGANDTAKKRFLAEARAAARVKSDHVITIYQIGEERGIAFAAMELLRGEPLDAWLKRGRKLGWPQLLRLAREMATGLAAAHDQGLVHRDVKPGNIWLEAPAGRVKLLDFGLARPISVDVHLTQLGSIVGTPAYMAPEQARGEKVDHRADLFSLGGVLYRLLTGQLPFKGDTTMAILMSLATDEPTPVLEICPDAPPALAGLVMRLLAKDAAARPPSAKAVVAELQGIDRKGPQPAAAVSVSFNPPPLPAKDNPFADLTVPSCPTMPLRATKAKSKPAPARTPPSRGRVAALIAAACGGAAVLLASVVLLLPTKDGTIRIEINDDAIEATVTKKGVKIKGSGKEDVSVEPGEHGLKIKRGDLEFETTKFVVRKGETVALKIEYLPGKVQVVQAGKVIGEKALPRPPEKKKDDADTVVEKKKEPDRTPVASPPDLPFKLTPGDHALRIDGEGKIEVPAVAMDLSKPFTIEMYFVMIGKPASSRWVLCSGGAAGVAGSGGDGFRFLSLEISVWRVPATLSYQPIWPRRPGPQAGSFLVRESTRYHVAAVHDGDDLRLYVNGKLNGKGTGAQLAGGETKRPFYLGAYGFCGLIDEVRLSKGARYDKDFTPGARHKPDADTLALYHCDEGKGDVLKDDSGHKRDIKFTGARWIKADGTEINPNAKPAPAVDRRGIVSWILDTVPDTHFDLEAAGKVVRISKSADLPAGRFEVVQMSMGSHPGRANADAALARLAELRDLESVGLTQGVTTATVVRLAGLPRLKYLGLAHSGVDTRAIPAVMRMKELEILQLAPRYADLWVEALAGHPTLRDLQFYRTDVTGKNFSKLTRLPRLKEVTVLECGRAAPEMLTQLEQVTRLEKITLAKVAHVATEQALARLRKALPKCKVE